MVEQAAVKYQIGNISTIMPRSIKKCEICAVMFVPSHSRTRTCSKACFLSLREKILPKTKEKIKKGLKEHYKKHPKKIVPNMSELVGNTTKGKYQKPDSIWDLSPRTIGKIFKRLNLGCSLCGWNEAPCDLHHILGKKIPDPHNHNNLTYVCPNCHRKAHSGKISKENFISLTVFLGDKWKDFYYG